MEKIIHLCWFGNKPLPKSAKKCIKSWEKFLPDHKIIMWSEANVDLNECAFIREAYQQRKWAFVADYARTKAIYEYGGIYLDTDVMIKKDITFLLDDETFLGVEDSKMVNGAVWGAKNAKSAFAKELLDFYQKQEHFNSGDIYSMSIPRIITKILNNYGFDRNSTKIQRLKNGVTVYPRDYFYPLSFNYQNNYFTKKTCMVHYFEATWISDREKRDVKIYRIFGEKIGWKIMVIGSRIKRFIRFTGKIILWPIVLHRKKIRKMPYELMIQKVLSAISTSKEKYIVFYNPEWFGVAAATKELFNSNIPCGEIDAKDISKIGDEIINSGVEQLIFSAMCNGWKELAYYLKSKANNIKIKVFWHGSISQVSEPYGWNQNMEIIKLNREGIIDVIGICKESLMNFYQKQKVNIAFLMNTVNLEPWQKKSLTINNKSTNNNKIRVGLYAAKSDDWRKNMFSQIAAVSMIDNAVIDMIPLTNDAVQFGKKIGVQVTGVEGSIPREKLLECMSKNDINIYVTFSECAPMLPIESMEVGTPCISGNNHHYFKNHVLEKDLIINNEADPESIASLIKKTIKNRDRIMQSYKEWKLEYDKKSDEYLKKFLDM